MRPKHFLLFMLILSVGALAAALPRLGQPFTFSGDFAPVSVDDGEYAGCRIEIDAGTNFWKLIAYSRSDGVYNATAKCEARCLQW